MYFSIILASESNELFMFYFLINACYRLKIFNFNFFFFFKVVKRQIELKYSLQDVS